MYSVWPLSFTIPRSAKTIVGVSVSVDVLLKGSESLTPTGVATVAVFTKLPEAPESVSAITVNTIEFPGPDSIFTSDKISLEPDAAPCIAAFPLATAVHIIFDKMAGKLSVTVAPTTSNRPLFVTVIV